MQICFIRDSVSLVMPVTPDTYQWTVGKRIETININALGDVYRPGGMTRFSGNLDFLLPAQDYPWMEAFGITAVSHPFSKVSSIISRLIVDQLTKSSSDEWIPSSFMIDPSLKVRDSVKMI